MLSFYAWLKKRSIRLLYLFFTFFVGTPERLLEENMFSFNKELSIPHVPLHVFDPVAEKWRGTASYPNTNFL